MPRFRSLRSAPVALADEPEAFTHDDPAQMTNSRSAPMHVLIAGGGVAGMEALLALSALAGDLVEIELLTPGDEFVYRPLQVAEPFGVAEVVRLELEPIVDEAGARHSLGAMASVDPAARTVKTSAGTTIGYDALLVAAGATPVEAVPGALTFSGDAERRRFGDLLAELGHRATRRLAFVVPRQVTWSIAAYELALLTAAERDARQLRGVELTLVTYESAPLEVFGAAISQLLAARLEQAAIVLRPSSVCERVEDQRLHFADGASLEVDRVVALPALEVPRIEGLPQRKGGFVQTDVAMRVVGLESAWAAGDVTWFPVKQGGLAAQQSDVAARSIAAAAGAHVPIEAFHPVLRAALITGGAPEFLQSALPSRDTGDATAGRGLWSPPTKIAARYLGPYVARALGEPPAEELADLGVSADRAADAAEHQLAIVLLLAAADSDAAIGDFEGALRWLSLVGELNLTIPAAYVARRHKWRRQLEPDTAPEAAARRIDPTFTSASAAISDLQRRLGWLREIERRTEGEMSDHLSRLDQGMEQLTVLSQRAGILEGSPPRGR
jgi:sulfide:quinone oxidoreductase